MKYYELIVLIALIVPQLIVNYEKREKRDVRSAPPPRVYEISRVAERRIQVWHGVSRTDEKSTGKKRGAAVFSPLESGREAIQWCVYAARNCWASICEINEFHNVLTTFTVKTKSRLRG